MSVCFEANTFIGTAQVCFKYWASLIELVCCMLYKQVEKNIILIID